MIGPGRDTLPRVTDVPSEGSIQGPHEQQGGKFRHLAKRLWRTARRSPIPTGALVLLLVSLVLWLSGWATLAQWVLFAIALLGGIPLLLQTLWQFAHKEFSVDLIAILAITGSLLLGQYLAGAFIVLMLSGGEALEAYALRRARSSLSALADRAPRTAHIWRDEQLIDIPAEVVEVGMEVVVKPGELIPVDGVVMRGSCSVSEADLTGEPVPVRKTPGLPVLSGSINLDGVLQVRTSKRSTDSKYAQIVRLVKEAQSQKAPIHRLADRYSLVFTVATLLLTSIVWLVFRDSTYALAVLVVATPCPLILATPIAIMSGIDVAAHHGIIIKSGGAIEQLGEVDIAVFDKTGTLTLGTPQVTTMVSREQEPPGASRRNGDALLYYAASVEQLSTHILGRAIVEAAQERALSLSPADDFEEIFGKGVRGRVPVTIGNQSSEQPSIINGRLPQESLGSDTYANDGKVSVAVGNRTFMMHLGIPLPLALLEERERRTAMGQICSFVALNGEVAGLIVLQDVPRAEVARLSADLKREGIKQTVLLTGDSEVVARQVGQMAQVDRVVARCLPEDKVRVVRELVEQKHRVLMVGDGINDAPALAAATVGMALGTQGLTAAASAADAVLLSPNILRVVTAVHLGRRVLRIALQGIWIGMGLSAIAMLFAAFGFISPPVGAILQEGVDVIVIFNALRAGEGVRAAKITQALSRWFLKPLSSVSQS